MPRTERHVILLLIGLFCFFMGFYAGLRILPFFAAIIVLYLGQAEPTVKLALARIARDRLLSFAPAAVFVALYLAYSALLSEVQIGRTLLLIGYLFIPYFLVEVARTLSGRSSTSRKPVSFLVLLVAVLFLWLPVEIGLFPGLQLPPGRGAPIVQFFAIIWAIYLFQSVLQLEGFGFTFLANRGDWKLAAVLFSIFIAFVAIPVGISLDFVHSTRHLAPLWEWPFRALLIFLLIAMPEEILFRGLIQNLLTRGTGRLRLALGITSVVFGLAHANNPSPPHLRIDVPGIGPVELSWVYLILATVAGAFYGIAYARTGKLVTAALVHAMVDFWWSVFFSGD